MKITIDVKRAEQSFDLTTMRQQNFLVIEFAGQEIKVPCDEAQLAAAIRSCMGHATTQPAPAVPEAPSHREFSYTAQEPEEEELEQEPEPEETEAVESPAMFVAPEPKPVPVPRIVQQQPAAPALRPVARRPAARQSDDAGISQG